MGHSAPPRRYLANSQPLLSRRMGVTAYHQAGGTYLLSPLSLPSLSIFARTALDTEVLERISANHSPHPSLLCGKAAVSSTSPPSSAKTCVLPFYSPLRPQRVEFRIRCRQLHQPTEQQSPTFPF